MHGFWLFAVVAVRLLALPGHATIDPFGDRALMHVSHDGTIRAAITIDGYRSASAAWHGNSPPSVTQARSTVSLPLCEDLPKDSIGASIAGTLDDGSLVATMLSPAMVDLDDMSGQYAPVVLHLRSRQCLNMGNGIALNTAGMYTGGYTAYIAGVPAPSNVVSAKERFVAMRWHDRTREPLGDGVAIAVNGFGNAAGSDVPPGKGASFGVEPHARVWLSGQAAADLAPNVAASVAYAIDDRNRVAGMLEDDAGRHYAFLWENGTLRRLDDVVHAAGWRFESAYVFAGDGSVIGIGTYRGTPAAFAISGL